MLTRITDQKIPCLYIHVYRITKNWGPGPNNSLRHADNRYFLGLSLTRNQREAHMFCCSCSEKSNFIMINKFKYVQTWKIWPSPLSLSLYNPFKYLHLESPPWSQHPVKCGSGDIMVLVCNKILQDHAIKCHVTLWIEALKVSYHPAKFDGHRDCGRGYIMFSVCHVTLHDLSRDQNVMWLYGLQSLKVSHHPLKFLRLSSKNTCLKCHMTSWAGAYHHKLQSYHVWWPQTLLQWRYAFSLSRDLARPFDQRVM